MKVLYSGYYESDGYPFHALAQKVEGVMDPRDITEKDSALVIWGGSDISPSLYKHPEASRTFPGGKRDFVEWSLMKRAIELGIPIIGVCRGAQMACAAAGGFLLQDVANHGMSHNVTTVNGTEVRVTSLHHQMMFAPPEVPHELLAWCDQPRSYERAKEPTEGVKPYYLWQDDQHFVPPEGFKEPECYYFPKIKALAIQWHPEMMTENADATAFLFNQMERFGWIKTLRT